jgi:hypothetical protein
LDRNLLFFGDWRFLLYWLYASCIPAGEKRHRLYGHRGHQRGTIPELFVYSSHLIFETMALPSHGRILVAPIPDQNDLDKTSHAGLMCIGHPDSIAVHSGADGGNAPSAFCVCPARKKEVCRPEKCA